MSFTEELGSWFAPKQLDIAKPPSKGDKAPSTDRLTFPRPDKKPGVVAFLRHCGCPFAEKTFRVLRVAADKTPTTDFIAVSHSNASHTAKWLEEVGGPGKVTVIVDEERSTYAAWGLGVSGWTHVLDRGVFSELFRLKNEEGIANRPTESGSRWQQGGAFAVDANGVVTWGGPAAAGSEIPDVNTAVGSVGMSKL